MTYLPVVEADETVGIVDPLLHEVAEHGAGHSGHLDRSGVRNKREEGVEERRASARNKRE